MIAWTIAGSDSGGGAGIQADLKTFHGLGVHGCTVITALTAQNTREVASATIVSTRMIEAQIEALRADLPPIAVKTGMLGSAAVMKTVAKAFDRLDCLTVCDPVMVATSGGSLMEPEARETLVKDLLPRVDLLTPNIPEAGVLLDRPIKTRSDVEAAARAILAMGAGSVWIKGGHGGEAWSSDYWTNGHDAFDLHTPRIDTKHTHGSGCTLSAAVTAFLARGLAMDDALVLAKAYVTNAIREAEQTGGGFGPVRQGGWPDSPRDMPWLGAPNRLRFPSCGSSPLGLYPIVDRAKWLEPFFSAGITILQLRIKDLEGEELEREIGAAAEIARRHKARLFINDHWRIAIEKGAYGVHLGQEDLGDANLTDIHRAGLRLGISTHTHRELARALAVEPSYIALGPIYETNSKELKYRPAGLRGIRAWSRLIDVPLVAIGGIRREKQNAVYEAGASGIAVISAIMDAPDPLGEAATWLEALL